MLVLTHTNSRRGSQVGYRAKRKISEPGEWSAVWARFLFSPYTPLGVPVTGYFKRVTPLHDGCAKWSRRLNRNMAHSALRDLSDCLYVLD